MSDGPNSVGVGSMSRQQGRGGMGSHKHGVSGHPGHPPKLRMWLKLLAKREEAWRRRSEFFGSVKELFRSSGSRQ
jgi:hypothetical protein